MKLYNIRLEVMQTIEKSMDELLKKYLKPIEENWQPSDLLPELQGRLPIRVELRALGAEVFGYLPRDAHVVRMDERAKVLSYRMTSQCASGSGQFLEHHRERTTVESVEVLDRAAQAPK